MAITEHQVQPLFVEPYFRAKIGHAISEDQIAYLKGLKMNENQTNLISDNLYIFEEKELRSLKKAVHEALDIFAKDVMGISQKLYVTQSWSLINPPGVGMHGHTHSNSIVSGSLYYADMPSPPAGMLFERHRTYQQIELHPEKGKVNIFNTNQNILIPEKNDLFLFSSSLQHFVHENQSDQPRYSVAFNTFIKGDIGNFRDVSALQL